LNLQTLILPAAVLALMYFMMIRPQQQQAKRRQEMLNSIKQGSEVVTMGGLHGTVVTIEDATLRLLVAPGIELTFNRSAVGVVKDSK
jgi:preprotein translocase subunit YajC